MRKNAIKYAAYMAAVTAFISLGVRGAIPSSAEGWYTPKDGFTKQSGTGTIYYGYDRVSGTWNTAEVEVDAEGKVSTLFESLPSDVRRNYALATAYNALVKACGNEAINNNQDEMITTIARNLANPLGPAGGLLSVNVEGTRRLVWNRPADTQTVDNAEFCPRAKSQTGDNCAAYAVATYIEMLRTIDRKDAETVDPHEMHDYALAHRPENAHGGDTRTCDCFDYWLRKTRDTRALAAISLVGANVEGEDKDTDDVRSMTTTLLLSFGAFVASVKTTDEWLLLDLRLEDVCRKEFGDRVDAIEGRWVKIKVPDGRAASGNHSVVVYGCDAKFVYFLNSWGVTWGDMGRGKITWREFARQFQFAELLADRAKIDAWANAGQEACRIVLQTTGDR